MRLNIKTHNRAIGIASLGMVSAALIPGCSSSADMSERAANTSELEILISGGDVYIGNEGEGPIEADIGINGERIVFIGDASKRAFSVKTQVDANGLTVAPGFIDPHTHATGDLFSENEEERQNLNYLTQGVTTVFIGNDGGGDPDIADRREDLTRLGVGTNAAMVVGHGAVRQEVVGLADRQPTQAELDEMKGLVEKAMCEGAFGFSSGLYYTPQNYSTTEEVVALASEAGNQNGYYDTHIRDESSYSIGLRAAISEAIEIGSRSGAPTHISHIKALGTDVWGASRDIVDLVEKARARGQQVTADQYPWLASGTRISNALLPSWALDGGLAETRKRFERASEIEKIETEMAENLRRRGGAEKILITHIIGSDPEYNNKTLAEVSRMLNLDAIGAAIKILKAGDARIASFNMQESDVEYFMSQPWVMTGSDGSSGHPRKYASFPKKYSKYVVEKNTLTPSDFIYRSAGLAAESFGIKERGFIREGYFADIVVFDPDAFKPNANYSNPELLSDGVVDLIVNGKLAIQSKAITGELSGRALNSKNGQDARDCVRGVPSK